MRIRDTFFIQELCTRSRDMKETAIIPLVITIDGPAGAGKSTVARGVAKYLGLPYLDTGAIYRAVTWELRRKGIESDDTAGICDEMKKMKITLSGGNISVNGADVTSEIRTPEIDREVSSYSANRAVRDALTGLQRDQASCGLVADGRDMGTVVFPYAELKIFLTADAEERARRRFAERLSRGEDADYEEVLSYVNKRDACDMNRQTAPLRPAPGCVILDSTSMSVEEVIDVIVSLASEIGKTKEI